MHIAILSDIHGNPLALDAVLTAIDKQPEIDAYWILGDSAALGYDPASTLDRLTSLPHTSSIRGNTDRLTLTASPEEATYAWTRAALTPTHLAWLSHLPLERRTTLPDSTRVLSVHAAPGTDEGQGIPPTLPDAELEEILSKADADLLLVGHTHQPMDREACGVRIINPGSVSNPEGEDVRAHYALLQADETGYRVQHHQARYDNQAVIAATLTAGHPSAAYITSCMRGEHG